MTKLSLRLKTIFDCIEQCDTFADVGCDHGYIANAMLESDKCKFVYITDISAECLSKAEELLSGKYYKRYQPIVTSGLKGVPKVDQAVIAGMGGEIICDILENADYLPDRLILQPMKDPERVRGTVLRLKYKILKDYTFKDEKFYDLIVCEKGEDFYTQDELAFGRDNLRQKNEAFVEVIQRKINVLQQAMPSMSEVSRKKTEQIITKFLEIIK